MVMKEFKFTPGGLLRNEAMKVARVGEAEFPHLGRTRGFLTPHGQFKLNKTTGVTLMEIMLVLAIAAMIIVMSVRYYQTTSSSQQANSALQQIQSITEIADRLAQGSGSYTTASLNAITALMPNKMMTSPWGTPITIKGNKPTTYKVVFPSMPPSVCALIVPRLKQNDKYTSPGCDTNGDFSYTYDAGF